MQDLRRLFASDLDGTLIDPDGVDLATLEGFRRFTAARPDFGLVYVTGRHFEHALDGIDRAELPRPRYLCTSVGTVLHECVPGVDSTRSDWRRDAAFEQWMRERVGERSLVEADPIVLADRRVRLQPPERSGEFKRSYFVEVGVDLDALADSLASGLASAGFSCSVLTSVDPVTAEGLIDLLPRDVTKADVVARLAARHGLEADAVCFAGDSGNDLEALCGPWHAIVVGNAPATLRARVQDRRREDGRGTRLLTPPVRTLGGVLEGLRELGWLGRDDEGTAGR